MTGGMGIRNGGKMSYGMGTRALCVRLGHGHALSGVDFGLVPHQLYYSILKKLPAVGSFLLCNRLRSWLRKVHRRFSPLTSLEPRIWSIGEF